MAKSASQITPLRTQLASSMNIIRFADASDLLTNTTQLTALQIPVNQGNGALYEERIYDVSAWSAGQQAPNVTAGVAALAGPPTLSAPTPSATGGQITSPCVLFSVCPSDASGRYHQVLYYVAQFPNNSATNSVVLTFNTAGLANVTTWTLTKVMFSPNGTTTGCSYHWTTAAMAGQTAFTYTDTYPDSAGSGGVLNAGTASPLTYNGVTPTTPNLATTVTGSWTMTGATSSTGGQVNYGYGHSMPVSICAYNKIGATTNSPVQYVNLGYTDAIAAGPTITATPSTASGVLAAGTYYYRVSATNVVGTNVVGISMPGPEISTTLAATGNVTVSWSAVAGATGYNVYRGTAAGNETMIASVSGLSCLDGGGTTSTIPVNTSASGCGPTTTGSIAYSWSAVAGAVGYRLFAAFGTGAFTANSYVLSAVTGTSYTATGAEVPTAATPQGTNNTGATMTRVFKHFVLNGTGLPTKIGLTFAPVAGKKYRASQIIPNNMYSGPWVTAATGNVQYMEFPLTGGQNQTDGTDAWYGVEGLDTSCLVGLPGATIPTSDTYGLFSGDVSTLVGIGSAGGTNISSTNAFSASADAGFLVPTAGAVPVPLRVVRRLQNMTTQLTTSGTLAGLATPSAQFMCTKNYTYAAPVKSIVPSWNAAVGSVATMQAEVSPDIGTTWYPLTNSVRFVFLSATSQMMFRFTVFGNTQSVTLMPGVDGLDPVNSYVNSPLGGGNGYFTADSGQAFYYTTGRGTSNTRMNANGAMFAYGNGPPYRDSFSVAQPGTNDADVSAWIDNTYQPTGFGGVFARSSTPDAINGYFLSMDSATPSNLNLYALTNTSMSSALPTAIATVALGLSRANRRLRLVALGSHLMGFVDGQLYIDITNSAITVGANVGVTGLYTTCSGFTINSTSTAAPASQMESFSAFLEY